MYPDLSALDASTSLQASEDTSLFYLSLNSMRSG